MKNTKLTSMLIALAMLSLTTVAVLAKDHQKSALNNSYVMQEPFSSAPLISYPSLEVTGAGS